MRFNSKDGRKGIGFGKISVGLFRGDSEQIDDISKYEPKKKMAWSDEKDEP